MVNNGRFMQIPESAENLIHQRSLSTGSTYNKAGGQSGIVRGQRAEGNRSWLLQCSSYLRVLPSPLFSTPRCVSFDILELADYLWIRSVQELIAIICPKQQQLRGH